MSTECVCVCVCVCVCGCVWGGGGVPYVSTVVSLPGSSPADGEWAGGEQEGPVIRLALHVMFDDS